MLVAVADRLDSLVGLIAAGNMPTATADPYGLRRAAYGMLQVCACCDYRLWRPSPCQHHKGQLLPPPLLCARCSLWPPCTLPTAACTAACVQLSPLSQALPASPYLPCCWCCPAPLQALISNRVSVSLSAAVALAASLQPIAVSEQAQRDAVGYIRGRLEQVMVEGGASAEAVRAVAAERGDNPALAVATVEQLGAALAQGEQLRAVMGALSRPVRIVRGKQVEAAWTVDPAKFDCQEERALHAALQAVTGACACVRAWVCLCVRLFIRAALCCLPPPCHALLLPALSLCLSPRAVQLWHTSALSPLLTSAVSFLTTTLPAALVSSLCALRAGQLRPDMSVAQFLSACEALIQPIDAFFDKVFVMAEDISVRNNRLALLRDVAGLTRGVVDLSQLPGF